MIPPGAAVSPERTAGQSVAARRPARGPEAIALYHNRTSTARAALAVLALAAALAAAAAADVVTLRDGTQLKGKVLEIDAQRAVIDLGAGKRETVERRQLLKIEFGEEAQKAVRATVRVNEADDELHLFLDGAELAPPAQLKAGPFDLAPVLKEGPNLLEAVVVNRTGLWAYRWTLEVNGAKEVFACGLAGRSGCATEGRGTTQTGEMAAGKVWLYVDHDSGEVKIDVESR